MAERLNPRHQQMVRDKIQASYLINRLHGCAMGEIEMTPVQVKAAEALLRKSVPDLKAVEHSGSVEVPVSGTVKFVSRDK